MGRYPDHIQDGAGVRRWRENEEWALKDLKGGDVSLRLLHEGDLLRCYRNSASVTYVSTLPAPSPSASGISSCVQSPSTFEPNVREWHFSCIIRTLATRMIGVAWKLLVILLNSLGDDERVENVAQIRSVALLSELGLGHVH